jgi:predicted  nucleic acid-binding Zn-ribbon protein
MYYFNFETGESIWDHPLDSHYKNMADEHLIRKRRSSLKSQQNNQASVLDKKKKKKNVNATPAVKLNPLSSSLGKPESKKKSMLSAALGKFSKPFVGELNEEKTVVTATNGVDIDRLSVRPSSSPRFRDESDDEDGEINFGKPSLTQQALRVAQSSKNKDHDKLADQIKELNQQVAQLQEQLAKNKIEVEKVNSEKETILGEKEKLLKQKQDAANDVDSVKKQVELVKREADAAKQQKEKLETDIEHLQDTNTELERKQALLRENTLDEIARLEKTKQNIEDAVLKIQSQRIQAEATKSALSADIVKLESDVEVARERSNRMITQVERLNEEKIDLEVSINSLKRKYEETKLDAEQVEHEQSLRSSTSELRKEEDILRRSIETMNFEQKNLLSARESEVHELEEKIEILSKNVRALEDQKRILVQDEQNEKARIGREMDILLTNKAKAQISVNTLTSHLETLEHERKELSEEINKLLTEKQILLGENKSLKSQNQELQDQIVTMQLETTKKMQEADSDTAIMNEKLASQQQQIFQLQNRILEYQHAESRSTEQRTIKEREVEDLESRLRQTVDNLDRAQDENQTLRELIVNLRNQKMNGVDSPQEKDPSPIEEKKETFELDTDYSKWQHHAMTKIKNEKDKLRRAKDFVREEKEEIKQKQKMLEKAREEWKADVSEMSKQSSSHQADRILRSVKNVLEKQALRLNDDIKQLNRIQRWIVLRREKLKLLEEKVLHKKRGDKHDDFSISPTSSVGSRSTSVASSTPSAISSVSSMSFMLSDEGTDKPIQQERLHQHHHHHQVTPLESYGDIGKILMNIENEISDIHNKIKTHISRTGSRAGSLISPRDHIEMEQMARPTSSNFVFPHYHAFRSTTHSVDLDRYSRRPSTDEVLSAKWDRYFDVDRYKGPIPDHNKLLEFQKQLCRWSEERDVERDILTDHAKWLRMFQQELSVNVK